MSKGSTRIQRSLERRIPALTVCLIWLLVVCWALPGLGQNRRIVLGILALTASVATVILLNRSERRRWIIPTRVMAGRIRDLMNQRVTAVLEPTTPEFVPIVRAVEEFRDFWREKLRVRGLWAQPSGPSGPRRGIPRESDGLEFPNISALESGEFDLAHSGSFSTVDMVNRLDPRAFVWIESSVAEQEFLGWRLEELRKRSFLEIVADEDRGRAAEALRVAAEMGESLGQVVKVVTARGDSKDVELNVGARYGADKVISHLRCHLTDVTEKIRGENELRLRTVALTDANEKLIRMNRELKELKDRYTDLYENAPAMYLSLNSSGEVIDCNRTFLDCLEYAREEIIGESVVRFLPEFAHQRFRDRLASVIREGAMEAPSTWRKRDGELIEVWISSSLVPADSGATRQIRCVARDVTARNKLEQEIKLKNESLARANAELSRKNRELDDFVYVVSHDLQEPLRTLIAFSDFLLKDYGERFDDEGREYVNYLIDASRRMRAMILAMLNLSRAGKVIGDFAPVELDELLSIVKADLGELIRARGAEIVIASPLPVIWGDRNRLIQLFSNLLANALKFNRSETPRVEVAHSAHDVGPVAEADPLAEGRSSDFVTIAVSDNGIGIDPEFHETIFQLFRRLHTQEEYEGTGAGLAICNKIVQAHGGGIRVESRAGAGATFLVGLRRASTIRQGGNELASAPTSTPTSP